MRMCVCVFFIGVYCLMDMNRNRKSESGTMPEGSRAIDSNVVKMELELFKKKTACKKMRAYIDQMMHELENIALSCVSAM